MSLLTHWLDVGRSGSHFKIGHIFFGLPFLRSLYWPWNGLGAWILFTQLPDVVFDSSCFQFPVKPCTKPSLNVVSLQTPAKTPTNSASISILVATCNILTMRVQAAERHDVCGIAGPARQDWILGTFHQHHVQVFGLQEARMKKLLQTAAS